MQSVPRKNELQEQSLRILVEGPVKIHSLLEKAKKRGA